MVIRRATKIEIETEGTGTSEPPQAGIPSVSEFTRTLRDLIEGEFPEIAIQGEIAGWNRAR